MRFLDLSLILNTNINPIDTYNEFKVDILYVNSIKILHKSDLLPFELNQRYLNGIYEINIMRFKITQVCFHNL